jgi:enediyne biosynthesis protein E4
MNEVRSGGSYLSQNDLRLRFGLGDADKADKVTVRWPDGSEDVLSDLPGDHLVVIAAGGKILSSTKYRDTPAKLLKGL